MSGWNTAFLNDNELGKLSLGSLGRGVLIHRTAVLVNCESIYISDYTRIDPFVVISAGHGVSIGRNVHIATHASITGSAHVSIGDFAGISQGARVLSASDDFSGRFLTGPTISDRYTNVQSAPVSIGRHVVIGAGSVVMPGCDIGEGATVGALSLINRPLESWMVYAGVPARPIRPRLRDLLSLEVDYLTKGAG